MFPKNPDPETDKVAPPARELWIAEDTETKSGTLTVEVVAARFAPEATSML